ncbi:molybdopterin-dependent oxidoreductase [Streptomonospora wellingtoniae]|uniref:Molybdopterin-dependent oxidoreductase n=1 Tax=Streptomonospora wellingtoniae TaxID=3075544 RepID=A0ABU2KNR6_9ACTN|nr:molybdopterin-dependent oxidoreductase [Streptomonospora sp. DSM 45055]MDT0300914.1 molybdopterin-dependent oxidoreductase [Streptomonospora sp. DSM 45055]
MSTTGQDVTRSAVPRPRAAGAVAGLLAAGTALGVGELAAGLAGTSSPVIVVGDALVDNSPSWAKDLAIALFGTYDKIALLTGVYSAVALLSAVLGALALRRPLTGYIGLAVFAAAGALAVTVRRTDEPLAVVPVLAGALAGEAALLLLLSSLRRTARPTGPVGGVFVPSAYGAPSAASGAAGGAGARSGGTSRSGASGEPGGGYPHRSPKHRGLAARAAGTAAEAASRRRFLATGAGVLAVAAASGGIGRFFASGRGVADKRAALRLPAAAAPLPPLPNGTDLAVPGLPPFTTPNPDFYRIDTALTVPRVDPDRWRLRIHGMVDRPVELDYDALLRRALIESDTALTCVSNQVGGDLAGNTRWLGVRLDDLLREAGVHSGADQVLSTSQDGWTCGTPTEAVLDGRDAILAVAMNGEPLPFAHGFPVRMVVPGLYGFVSATKWVTDIRLTRFADARAYWAQRGWALKAPIKTMSRIDVPRPLEETKAGPTTVAGVAWAQRRGIEVVEVRVDGGTWREARLAEVPGIDTWVQWSGEFDLRPGRHTFEVRATDNSGYTQTSKRVEPIPDGASGWHSVQITTV